jgi:aminotransferase
MKEEYDIYQGAKRLEDVAFSAIRQTLDRAAELRAEGKDVVSLSAGEPSFHTPETIKEECIRAIRENYTHYGSNRGYLPLREKIAKEIFQETGVSYDPESEIVFTTGGAEGLNNIILSLVDPGDEVIIISPAFVTYRNLVYMCGGKPIELSTFIEDHFYPDLDAIEGAITDRTKLLILNNPNNPTGAVYPREIIEKICKLAIEHNFLILSDEMYSQLVYEGEFVSVAQMPGMKERSLIVNGFSKTYAMTGWRIGYLYADKRLVSHIMKVHQYSSTCSPTFIQVGMDWAIEQKETQDAVAYMREEFRKRREILMQELDQIAQLQYAKPQGAFYALVDVSATGLLGEEFAKRLLEEYYTAVVPIASMGIEEDCRNYIRISFAASEEAIREGVQRIGKFVDVLMGEK